MARDWTLLERLGNKPPRAGETSITTRTVNDQVRSILHHLQRLLNARQGHAAAQMGYGIPDPSEVLHGYGDAITAMSKAIKASVEKYETRLTGVQVRYVATPDEILTLRFQITGQLAKTKERVPVVFDTHVDASGRIKVMS